MRLRLLAGAAALALVPSALAADDLEPLRRTTVQIRIDRENGSHELGSGVVLCQKESTAYFLTAHHVFYGQSHGGRNYRASDNLRTEVSFYQGLAPALVEDLDHGEDTFKVERALADKDLLLFTAEVRQKLPTAKPANPPAELRNRLGRRLHGVTAVGLDWATAKGEMDRLEGIHLVHSARIEKGYSGGPLFDEAGGLVGINVEHEPDAKQTPEPPGERTSRAVLLKEVEKSFGLPSGCIESLIEDDAEESAHQVYKEALRALNFGQRDQAIKLLEEALAFKDTEGGALVHLQGMRFTEYLPHYQLGLVQYRRKDFGAAHAALTKSYIQGAIHKGDKRYKTLLRLKRKAFALTGTGSS